MVLCVDVVLIANHRFDCWSSAIISTPHSGYNLPERYVASLSAALPKIEASALPPFRFRLGLLY